MLCCQAARGSLCSCGVAACLGLKVKTRTSSTNIDWQVPCFAGYDWKSFRLLFRHFWHRLVGTGGIWFCNDWYFYGNGVFRSTFVGLLVGTNASVQVNWLYSYINAGVQVSLRSV